MYPYNVVLCTRCLFVETRNKKIGQNREYSEIRQSTDVILAIKNDRIYVTFVPLMAAEGPGFKL